MIDMGERTILGSVTVELYDDALGWRAVYTGSLAEATLALARLRESHPPRTVRAAPTVLRQVA